MKIRVWTQAYRPFIMGGDVHQPVCTELDCTAAIEVAKGVYVHGVISPRGKAYFVESQSGGIVGDDFDTVKEDANSAPIEEILQQLQEQTKRGQKACPITPEEFWRLMKQLPKAVVRESYTSPID